MTGFAGVALVVIAVAAAACGGEGVTDGGRVVIAQREGALVVRDTTNVLELALARSSKGLAFEPFDLPEHRFPGRVALDDPKHGRAFVFWITRLGAKRPANVQRWFDEKVAILKRDSTMLADAMDPIAGHPARVVDYVYKSSSHRQTRQRFVAVDFEAHDLSLVIVAIAYASPLDGKASPDELAWLDAVVADAGGLTIR